MVAWLSVAVLYAVLVRATWGMLEIVHDERTPILQIPTSVTYSCVLVGMVMLALLAVLSAWRAYKGVRVEHDQSEPGAQSAQG
jgi:TRAP-type C4-dicarboxylate transport system permease small subunit